MLIRKAKVSFYKQQFLASGPDPEQFWKIIKIMEDKKIRPLIYLLQSKLMALVLQMKPDGRLFQQAFCYGWSCLCSYIFFYYHAY